MIFDNWSGLRQILLTTLMAYPILIIFLRLSGKRTLSKWNAFDFVVTIALGSILASVMLSNDVAVLEGLLGLGLLVLFQYCITFISVRVEWFESIIKSNPTLIYKNDTFLLEKMKKHRVSRAEILAAVRSSSTASLDSVRYVVLETDGSFSVIKKSDEDTSSSALENVI